MLLLSLKNCGFELALKITRILQIHQPNELDTPIIQITEPLMKAVSGQTFRSLIIYLLACNITK